MAKIKTAFRAIKILKNWPIYFLDYFKLVKKPFIFLKLRNGLVFKIRSKTNDRVIFNQIWLTKTYTPRGSEIKEDNIILDVGAHIGLFSLLAAKAALKGKVYAFEPSADNFLLLKENIELNKINNVVLIDKAVAQKSGTREFALSPDDPAGHALPYEETNRRKVSIPVASLDDFIKENNVDRIDFLKMDCEGAEYEIFFDCSDEILKKINKISMEYHDVDAERTVEHIKNFLEKRGFDVFVKTVGDNMLYAKSRVSKEEK